jgi:hypothetical protein
VGESFDLLPLLSFHLFIECSLSFIILFSLVKPLSWILLFNSFPMPITILEFEFWIKSYGFLKFPKSPLTFPPHYHVESMWFPITYVILRGVDVAPITCPHSCWDLASSCPPSLSIAFPDNDVIRPSHHQSSPLTSTWTLPTPFSNDDATCPISSSKLYSLMVVYHPESVPEDNISNGSWKLEIDGPCPLKNSQLTNS